VIFERLVYKLVPAQSAEFLRQFELVMPVRRACLGNPFGVYTTEIGALNELTLITPFADPAALQRANSILHNREEWKNFESKTRADVLAKSSKIMSPARFMREK
jgi:hypothetical protein